MSKLQITRIFQHWTFTQCTGFCYLNLILNGLYWSRPDFYPSSTKDVKQCGNIILTAEQFAKP